MNARFLPRSTPPRRNLVRLKEATLAALRELDSCCTLADFAQLDGYRKPGPVRLRLAGRGQQREVVAAERRRCEWGGKPAPTEQEREDQP